jgi:predicted O-linked N-acetylglucosamine transferase (SPINDLY family)
VSLEAAWQALEGDDFRAAERAAREALARAPGDAEALFLLGSTWLFEGRARDALAPLAEAVRNGARRGAGYRLGHCYLALGEDLKAEAALRREIAAHPGSANARNTLGVVLARQDRQEEALAEFLAALRLDARHAEAANNAASALSALGRRGEALEHLRRAVELDPRLADAHHNLGLALRELQRHEEAAASFARALALAPRMPYALSDLVRSEIAMCRWDAAEPHVAALRAQVREGEVPAMPFDLVAVSPAPEEQRRCAERHARELLGGRALPERPRARAGRGKIRIAYLSADFQDHATAWLAARLFELHERRDFEVIGVSYGEDDGGPMRRRLAQAFDRFVDLSRERDAGAAGILRELAPDIAVELKGYTRGARPALLAARPAPVQVSYLGYPGTMGAPWIDYLVADRVLIPADEERFYSEAVVCLPGSYQANDATRLIAARAPARAQARLPEDAFVFCCFNNNYKITREVFAAWLRLLAALPRSVLWLLEDNPAARRNLEQAAAAGGVAPARLVFAPRAPQAEHLARQRLADLFLDTLPCNAHTTASDALWSGVPVLTCLGTTFAGRVAASLLHAVGLPELVARSLAEYEALALRLAREPGLLPALRERLAGQRLTAPLFDSERFCRHLEAAYRRMWETRQRGEPPRPFAVAPA